MKNLYGLKGEKSGQIITSLGKVITHTNREELEFLFPRGVVVVPVNVSFEDSIPVQFVPGMEAVKFPLRREDFKNAR